jgi:sigma-E factor negative regulatory protein RseA
MEKISELMDGELRGRKAKTQIQRLEHDPELGDIWGTYHLIGDVLRKEAGLGASFNRRLHEALDSEPIVIAPHMRTGHRLVRHSLPLAAGFGGVALVVWLAMSLHPSGPQPAPVAAMQAPPAAVASATAEGPASAYGAANDYLRAHQEFSPTAAMQGMASYVRTVAVEEGDPAR